MEDKVKSGIIHCANYVCNGCPYDIFRYIATVDSAAAGYVRCMQKLIEDIYWTKTNGTDYEMPILRGDDRKYVDDEVYFVEEE